LLDLEDLLSPLVYKPTVTVAPLLHSTAAGSCLAAVAKAASMPVPRQVGQALAALALVVARVARGVVVITPQEEAAQPGILGMVAPAPLGRPVFAPGQRAAVVPGEAAAVVAVARAVVVAVLVCLGKAVTVLVEPGTMAAAAAVVVQAEPRAVVVVQVLVALMVAAEPEERLADLSVPVVLVQ
jgi:hypothetical protein